MTPSASSPQSNLPVITLATRVTLLRILGIPVFVLLMIYYTLGLREGRDADWYRVAALGVFVLIALTDALDGYLARSRNEVTRLGKTLDPLADKLLLLSAVILLTRPALPQLHPQLPIWFAWVVISRDLFLVIGAWVILHMAGRVEVHPRLTGKAATFFQMTSVVGVLMEMPARPLLVLAGLAAGLTFLSGLQYLWDGLRQIEHAHRAPSPKSDR